MAYVYWALQWKTKRTSFIDHRSIGTTRREAVSHLTTPDDTPQWREQKVKRLADKSIKPVKIVVLTLEEYRKLENP